MMNESLQKAQEAFQKSILHLKDEFSKLQIGRASASLVENLMVESYGMQQPLKALANISVPEARTLSIQPWDRGVLAGVGKAIRDSGLGLNPVNNGASIILNIPALTEERRRDLVKVLGRMAEDARVAVRNARQEAMAVFKRLEGDSQISEDDRRNAEKKLQDFVDKANQEIQDLAKEKEDQIMKV